MTPLYESTYSSFYAGTPRNGQDLYWDGVCASGELEQSTRRTTGSGDDGATRLWGEGFRCTIVAIAQTVDELAIGAVFDGNLCNAVLVCIGKNRFIILDVLRYAFHEKVSFVCGLVC